MDSRCSMEGQGLNLSTTVLPRPKIYDRRVRSSTSKQIPLPSGMDSSDTLKPPVAGRRAVSMCCKGRGLAFRSFVTMALQATGDEIAVDAASPQAKELCNRSMTSTKNKLAVLTTVYPPISNADAVRLMRIRAVEEMLRTSDFYMIGARAEAHLSNSQFDQDTNEMNFDFSIGDGPFYPVHVALQELPGVKALKDDDFMVEFDKAGSGFKVWDKAEPKTDKDPPNGSPLRSCCGTGHGAAPASMASTIAEATDAALLD